MYYCVVFALAFLAVESKYRYSAAKRQNDAGTDNALIGRYIGYSYNDNYFYNELNEEKSYEIDSYDWNNDNLWDSSRYVKYEQKCMHSGNEKVCYCNSRDGNEKPFKCDAFGIRSKYSYNPYVHRAHIESKYDNMYMEEEAPIKLIFHFRYPMEDKIKKNVNFGDDKTGQDLYDDFKRRLTQSLSSGSVDDYPFKLFWRTGIGADYELVNKADTLATTGISTGTIIEMGGDRGATKSHHLLNHALIDLVRAGGAGGINGMVLQHCPNSHGTGWDVYYALWGWKDQKTEYIFKNFQWMIDHYQQRVSTGAVGVNGLVVPQGGPAGLNGNFGGNDRLMYDPNSNTFGGMKTAYLAAINTYLQNPTDLTLNALKTATKTFNAHAKTYENLRLTCWVDEEVAELIFKQSIMGTNDWNRFTKWASHVYSQIQGIPDAMKKFVDDN